MLKQSKARELENNPIVVNVGTEEAPEDYMLKPRKISDGPTNTDLSKLIRLLKTDDDWHNLISFFTGLHSSKRTISAANLEIIMRKSGELGMESYCLFAATQSQQTGVFLRNPDVAWSLLFALRQKAEKAGFKGPDAHLALQQVEVVARLLNSPEHTNEYAKRDPKRQPNVIGILLELKATHALDAFNGRDEDKGVWSYADKLVRTWPLEEVGVSPLWTKANWRLRKYVPMWNGINMALQVEGIKSAPAFREALEKCRDELAETIDGNMEVVGKYRDQVTKTVAWTKTLYK
ncbi:uncharacterized protein GIQ15_06448 [Arthroderma uncinatum]|uniref:uncharacterized protein n=1 Tax=Arthroderma uncinatum TaxID=74035 RepID=UPI00144AFA02|nr:uncharacterized protein GIQ15_06448 [Arthroderma uncinatum]KAF3479472.1 hypothetical protein GIQ15_06448 [Arthroderma uncinatum]